MIKKIFILAFICTLIIGCKKDTVQLGDEELASSKLSASSYHEDLPSEVRDIIANGGVGHFGCENTNRLQGLDGGSLGAYAYPYTWSMRPLSLLNSSLPCQPNIPYFIFSHINSKHAGKSDHSVTFRLVLNPSYFASVKVFGIDWELNGQNEPTPFISFTVDDLEVGESNSVTCRVFSTGNSVAVYSQEMTFDFNISVAVGTGAFVDFESGSTYACTNTGIFPIIAP